jgi:ankyrin repeat protein/Cdc6-like AAA superfamily ATPase
MYMRQKNIRDALSNTCNWFFSTPEYYNWANRYKLSEHHGLLWIKGKPGAGKSTLMKETLHRTEENYAGTRTTTAGFFFNARSAERLEKTPLGLFRSILHQVLQQNEGALSYILPNYLQKKETQRQVEWHQADLQKFLYYTCTIPDLNPVFIFIDALDECNEREVRDLVDFFRDLTNKAWSEGAQLSVCLSSRHYPNISAKNCPEVVVEHHNEQDILEYIRTEAKYVNTVSRLQDKIFAKSQGVFLWVVLVVSMLKRSSYGKSLKWMEKKLEEIPPKLESLFYDIFQEEATEKKDTRKAICLVQWILFAEEWVKVSELHCILGFSEEYVHPSIRSWEDSDEFLVPEKQIQMITTLSRGLVEPVISNEDEPSVQFIHESVRDFFLTGSGFQLLDPKFRGSINGKAHSAIALTCVNYLQTHEISNAARRAHSWTGQPTREPLILLRYVATHLFTHIEEAEQESVDQSNVLGRLISDRGALFNSLPLMFGVSNFPSSDEYEKGESALYYCSRHKLFSCVHRLLELGEDANERTPTVHQYPLLTAASSASWGNPLASAVKTVQVLLDAGADVNLKNKGGNTALHVAAEGSKVEVVDLLLKAGADVTVEDKWKQTALHIAAWRSTSDVIGMLLDAGADAKAVDVFKMTPMDHSRQRANHDEIELVFITKEHIA